MKTCNHLLVRWYLVVDQALGQLAYQVCVDCTEVCDEIHVRAPVQ